MAYQKRESDYSPAHPELKIVPIRAMRIGIFGEVIGGQSAICNQPETSNP